MDYSTQHQERHHAPGGVTDHITLYQEELLLQHPAPGGSMNYSTQHQVQEEQ
jgi:hypothetical protein